MAVSKQYRCRAVQRRGAVYNLAIPNTILKPVSRALRRTPNLRGTGQICCVLLGLAMVAHAADWSGPERQLASKIATVTGSAAITLTVENRSSLGKRDSEVIQNGLRSALESAGVHFVKSDRTVSDRASSPAATSETTAVKISLSENFASYVWVAEIHQGAGEPVVVMVSSPRSESSLAGRESVPLSLRKILLWTQADPILDVAVLEESAAPTRIAVLDAGKVAIYRSLAGKWQQEQALEIAHARPWPRDLRGRLILAKDHLLDVYLPGVVCHSSAGAPLTLSCRESDDPWPLVPAALSGGSFSVFPGTESNAMVIPAVGAFYAPMRNFFTGVLTPGVGRLTTVSKFYSAAVLPRDQSVLWLFAATDGHVHVVDGASDQPAAFPWGSDLASVKTACGSGWQVLATSSEEGSGDWVRAFEFPDRDPVAVSGAVDFLGGVITALWTEAKGDTAVVVVRSRETGSYDAFRLAVACSQ
jgi:hypothetical protein